MPQNTLLQIYRALIFPCTSYDIAVWGQAAQCHNLKKILNLQKRALRLMRFPLFVSSNILPVDMLYFETVSTLMHDISTNSAPPNILDLFNPSSNVHPFNTRFLAAGNFHVNQSRLNFKLKSFTRFGMKLWNSLRLEWRKHLQKIRIQKTFMGAFSKCLMLRMIMLTPIQ